jgi:hypothetical protein
VLDGDLLLTHLRFTANIPILKQSCQGFDPSLPNNSDEENANLKSAISSVGSSSGVDPRFILAIVMQESNGCVRVDTTNGGVRNPGLMQSHNGQGTCNDNGVVQSPCPADQITQMIKDGTNGVSGGAGGPGLADLIQQAGTSDDSKYYIAARMYNSGSVAAGGNLGAGGATHCYSTDVANRLVGWTTGTTECDPGTIGVLNGIAKLFSGVSFTSDGSSSSGGSGQFQQQAPSSSAAPTPTPTPTPAPAPAPVVAPAPAPAAPTTTPIATPGQTIADVSPAVVAPPTTDTVNTITPGTACTTEGEWNCIAASSFQQCASGVWSAVQQVAEGTVCKAGKSAAIQISDAGSRRRHLAHLAQAHGLRHAVRGISH